MQFHIKKIDLFDFTSFFDWTFFNFLGGYGYPLHHLLSAQQQLKYVHPKGAHDTDTVHRVVD